jgi:hypothetical protein
MSCLRTLGLPRIPSACSPTAGRRNGKSRADEIASKLAHALSHFRVKSKVRAILSSDADDLEARHSVIVSVLRDD